MKIIALLIALLPALLLAASCGARRSGDADLRCPSSLQPRRLGSRAAARLHRDPAQGQHTPRPGVELQQRGHPDAAGRGARHDRARAAALSLAWRARHLGARSDGHPVRRGPAVEAQVRGDRRVPYLRRRRRPAEHAAHRRARPSARTVPPFALGLGSSRPPLRAGPERPRAVGSLGLRAAGERARHVAQVLDAVVRSCFPDRACLERQGDAGVARGFLEFPDRFLVGTDTFTPERLHYIAEHARWSRQWLSDLPRDVAEKIAFRNGERLFGGPAQ